MEYCIINKPDINKLTKYLDNKIYNGFSVEMFLSHRADNHILILDNNNVVARCSIWWENVPCDENEILGIIGHFEATSKEATSKLLDICCDILEQQGCTLAIGPMDGNTWHTYRFVTWTNNDPKFFLEPENPVEYPSYFTDAGFSEYKKYESDIENDLTTIDNRVGRAKERLAETKIAIRSFNSNDFFGELKKIYDISVKCFPVNPLYMEIDEKSFIKQYEKLLGKVSEELILIAERGDNPIGFVFTVPNFEQALMGKQIDTVIFKTIAVLPGRENAGLGSILIDKVKDNCRRLGLKKAIYALMYDSNNSKNIAKKNNAVTMRRYTLYAKDLRL